MKYLAERIQDLFGQTNRFVLRAAENPDISIDDLELVFAELPKFQKEEDQLETIFDKWFYFLKHAGSLRMVPKSLEEEPAIRKAFELANKAGLTQEELDDQERREMFIQDQRGAVTRAERVARKEGEATMLRRQLQHRFGVVPAWASEKITQAELSSLEKWGIQVLDASTLDDVFADRAL